MSIVVVGSVAYDGVETPHGKVERMLGGAATYISLASSYFAKTQIVAVVGDDFADAIGRQVARAGAARRLEVRVIGRDVGIETRGRRCDHVDGDAVAGLLRSQLVDIALHALRELGVGLGKIGAAGRGGVVAIACCRWTRMEVLVGGEALRDELGADDLPIAFQRNSTGENHDLSVI